MKDALAAAVHEVFGADELAEQLAPSRAQPPPDTPWRPLSPLPRTFLRCIEYGPPGGSWRRRGGVMFSVNEIRVVGAHMVGQWGWVAIADGRPLMNERQARFAFLDERDAQEFCDGLDLNELGDYQL
jgi:hypothetical protein